MAGQFGRLARAPILQGLLGVPGARGAALPAAAEPSRQAQRTEPIRSRIASARTAKQGRALVAQGARNGRAASVWLRSARFRFARSPEATTASDETAARRPALPTARNLDFRDDLPVRDVTYLTTDLRRYYDALAPESLEEREQTILAQDHAERPAPLLRRFRKSVAAAEQLPPLSSQDFYPGTSKRKDPRTHELSERGVVSTFDFASQLVDRAHLVAGCDELGFAFVDREIFPARSTEEIRMDERQLDLLLAASDGLPIVAELKIRKDKPAYYALVQVLMHASELVSRSQRDRLARCYPAAGFRWPEQGPLIDVYLIGYEADESGTYRGDSFAATERISEKLMADRRFRAVVRRIAYLNASLPGDALEFERRFEYS